MYKSLPSNSKGEYGLTEVIVGTLSFTVSVGIISTIPPIAKAIADKTEKYNGILSNQRCFPSPSFLASEILANAGASTGTSFSNEPCLTVAITLITIRIEPVRYNNPPKNLI